MIQRAGGIHTPGSFRTLINLNFLELRKAEVQLRRIPLPRTPMNKGVRKGRSPEMEPRPSARAAYSKPYPRTVNFQFLLWLPAIFGFWSRALPAKSCAPVVTVAL